MICRHTKVVVANEHGAFRHRKLFGVTVQQYTTVVVLVVDDAEYTAVVVLVVDDADIRGYLAQER